MEQNRSLTRRGRSLPFEDTRSGAELFRPQKLKEALRGTVPRAEEDVKTGQLDDRLSVG